MQKVLVISLILLVTRQLVAEDTPKLKYLYSISQLTKSEGISEPQSIFIDRLHDEIYISDTGNNRILVFNKDGLLIQKIDGAKNLISPLGIAVDVKLGNIYVSERESGKLKVLNFRGEGIHEIVLSKLGRTEISTGRLTLDKAGNLYAIDGMNQEVLAFDMSGNFKFRFGGMGTKEGQFEMLQDIGIDEDGRVYAVSSLGTSVQVFDRDGRYLFGFGKHGGDEAKLSFPAGIGIDRNKRLWLTDSFQHSLKVFDHNGKFLFKWGNMGKGNGDFLFPIDIDFDSKGNIYVLEKGNSRVQVFEEQ